MKLRTRLMAMVMAVAAGIPGGVEGGPQFIQRESGYDAAAMGLRSAPAKEYEFNRAVLRDVLRFLADDAGLSYIALPEADETASMLVTFSITASPFAALEMIAETHGVALVHDHGVWHMRPVDDEQLIGRTYQIRFNPGEVVTTGSRTYGASSSNVDSTAINSAQGSRGGAQDENSFGVGNFYTPDMSLNNLGAAFTTNADQLIEDIEKILGIRTSGIDANIAPTTTVGAGGKLQIQVDARQRSAAVDSGAQPQVIWNSDSNTLFVVASRQQHQYVEAYLESVDRPQPLIAIEVKFFETGSDPRKQFGIDWSGTLSNYNVTLGNLNTSLDLNDLTTALYPNTAILNADAMTASLNAIVQDSDTTAISYPRMITRNNREVTIQSVVNEPVLAATSSTSQGIGGISTASVTYLPIGTTVNVLPKLMPDGTINMHLAVTVSSIIGNVLISGNSYPKASSRVYTAPLKLKSGYTAAIAGLDEAGDSVSDVGVPFLSKLPVLGMAFRDRLKQRTRKNLMIWITPYVLDNDEPGVSETPVSELPITKHDPLRMSPEIYASGEPVGGIDALPEVILWADREQRRLANVVKERRIDDKMREDVGELIRLCESLVGWLDTAKESYPSRADELAIHQWSVEKIRRKTQHEDWVAFMKSDFY